MMFQVRLVEKHTLKKEQAPVPRPRRNEVLISVAYCGICGSDVHAFEGRHPFISTPILQGHEFSGTISRVGAGVDSLKVGDRVTVEPSLVCGRCHSCRSGRYNICSGLRVLGCQVPGAFAEFVRVPSAKVFKVPANLSLKHAALVEPLAVGVHAVRRGGVKRGSNVVVIGAGTIGLMTMQAAKALGAVVLQTDVQDYRLRLAAELGADRTANAAEGDLARRVKTAFGDTGADVIFECAGTEASLLQAFRAARKGSRLIAVAVYTRDMTLPMGIIQDWELELLGTLMYTARDYRTAIRYLHTGKVVPSAMISHEIELADLEDGYRLLLNPAVEKIKIIVRVAAE